MITRQLFLGLVGACMLGLSGSPLKGEGAVLSLKPIGSSGAYVIAGNSIQILPGGATVDFEVLVSGWSSAPGNPLLSAVCSTLDHHTFLGANASPPNPGVDLLPLGYALPDPNGGNRMSGHYIVQNVCQASGRDCTPGSGQQPCMSGEGSCVVNPRWFAVNHGPLAFLALQSLTEYQSGGVCQVGAVVDPQNETLGYVSTLRLVIPPNASGTYTVGFKNNENFTFLNDEFGLVLPLDELRPARITIASSLSPDPALNFTKNRYVSFAPAETGTVAYRIDLVSSDMNPAAAGFAGWLGAPVIQAGVVGTVSKVVSAPVFRTWNEFAVHVGDCEIMPGSAYELRSTPDGITFSSPIAISTTPQPFGKDWGDVVGVFDGTGWTPPNGIANISDIVGIIAAREGKPAAPAAVRCDLETVSTTDSCLNQLLNAGDIFVAVLAVRGVPYPFERNPALCLSCP